LDDDLRSPRRDGTALRDLHVPARRPRRGYGLGVERRARVRRPERPDRLPADEFSQTCVGCRLQPERRRARGRGPAVERRAGARCDAATYRLVTSSEPALYLSSGWQSWRWSLPPAGTTP